MMSCTAATSMFMFIFCRTGFRPSVIRRVEFDLQMRPGFGVAALDDLAVRMQP